MPAEPRLRNKETTRSAANDVAAKPSTPTIERVNFALRAKNNFNKAK